MRTINEPIEWRAPALVFSSTAALGLVAFLCLRGRTDPSMAWIAAATGLVVPVLGAVAAAFMSRAASRRAALATSARRIASGDVKHRVSVGGNGTLASLATALNEMAARLAQQESTLLGVRNELEAILQSMDGGVIVLSMSQRVLSMNRAAEWMLGVTEGQTRGKLIQEATRQPELNRFVAEALVGPREESEFPILGQPVRRVRATHSLLHDSEGNPVGLLVVLNDITQLRRLESVRSDFASNVSHELRTPITNIKGYVETLLDLDVASDPEQTVKFLRIIARNADRLGAIVEDMLMLTQLERPDAKETLAVEHTRILPVLESAASGLEAEAAAKSISISIGADEDLAGMVNAALVEQAVSNLIVNAIRYSPVGTRVWIHASKGMGRLAGEHVEIAVQDEGPGIADEHLLRIFERFYRVDKARSREQGGTGLGLAIVKHIMQLHAGRVDVESAIGKGSTFRIMLPAD